MQPRYHFRPLDERRQGRRHRRARGRRLPILYGAARKPQALGNLPLRCSDLSQRLRLPELLRPLQACAPPHPGTPRRPPGARAGARPNGVAADLILA